MAAEEMEDFPFAAELSPPASPRGDGSAQVGDGDVVNFWEMIEYATVMDPYTPLCLTLAPGSPTVPLVPFSPRWTAR